MSKLLYDFYADMYATHREIGYLLWLMMMNAVIDAGLAIGLCYWPQSDVYLVQGITTYAEVPVLWGAGNPSWSRPSHQLHNHRIQSHPFSIDHGSSQILAGMTTETENSPTSSTTSILSGDGE